MSQKAAYAEFCATAPDLPVFMEPWYLDALCEAYGTWEVIVLRRGERIVAAWPYFVKRKFGIRYSVPPPFCKYVGPYFLPPYRADQRVVAELTELFPTFGAVEVSTHPELHDWTPFYQNNWTQTTRYTYRIRQEDWPDWEKNLPKKVRKRLQQVRESVFVETVENYGQLYELFSESFDRKNIPVPLSHDHLRSVDTALQSHHRRKIFLARDAAGTVHGMSYVCWDKRCTYVLFSGNPQIGRQSHANYILIERTLKFAFEENYSDYYDFLGSMLSGVVERNRKMGGRRTSYHLLTRTDSRPVRWYQFLKNELKIRP